MEMEPAILFLECASLFVVCAPRKRKGRSLQRNVLLFDILM